MYAYTPRGAGRARKPEEGMPRFRHLTSTLQLDRSWVEPELFALCDELHNGAEMGAPLTGRSLYCLFYEPSFLTRTSFERAIGLLGGAAYHTEDATQFFPVQAPSYIGNTVNLLASMRLDLVVLRSSEPGVVEMAERADAIPVVNGGSLDDHPTQALADIYTLRRELGAVDGATVAVVGRLEHRNVSALLRGLCLYDGVRVLMMPVSGGVDPKLVEHCESNGVSMTPVESVDALGEADAIYLNGPRTMAHVRLLRSRGVLDLRIDEEFMARLQSHCVVLDPMQHSGDFPIEVRDDRLAFYRQSENALFVRMAVLSHLLG